MADSLLCGPCAAKAGITDGSGLSAGCQAFAEPIYCINGQPSVLARRTLAFASAEHRSTPLPTTQPYLYPAAGSLVATNGVNTDLVIDNPSCWQLNLMLHVNAVADSVFSQTQLGRQIVGVRRDGTIIVYGYMPQNASGIPGNNLQSMELAYEWPITVAPGTSTTLRPYFEYGLVSGPQTANTGLIAAGIVVRVTGGHG